MQIPGRTYFSGEEILSDWFPRGGDGIILRAEIIDEKDEDMEVKIDVLSKNSEDPGNGTAIGWTLTLGAEGLKEMIAVSDAAGGGGVGLKEQVRLKIYTASGSAGDWSIVRIFPPIFFDAAR